MSQKVGVVPFKLSSDGSGATLSVLMVTSQSRGRWIFPKGNLEVKESRKKGCKREAWEEAGITGKIFKDYPITVSISKGDDDEQEAIAVTFFPMLVKKQRDSYPEADQRKRKWIALDALQDLEIEDDYRQVIDLFTAISPWVIERVK